MVSAKQLMVDLCSEAWKSFLSSLATDLWDLNTSRNIALPSQCDMKYTLTPHFLILLWAKTEEGGCWAVPQRTASDEARVTSFCLLATAPQHRAQRLGLFVKDIFWLSPYKNIRWRALTYGVPLSWPVPQYKGTFRFGRTPSRLSMTFQYFRLNTAYGAVCPRSDLVLFMPYPDSWNVALRQAARWAVLSSAGVHQAAKNPSHNSPPAHLCPQQQGRKL